MLVSPGLLQPMPACRDSDIDQAYVGYVYGDSTAGQATL